MKAIILAQGMGTRMHPLSIEIPKPLIPVKKKPIINYIVDMFLQNEIKEFAIPILKKDLEDFLWWKKRYYDDDNVTIKFFISITPKGTYGAIKQCTSFINTSEPFWVSNGDEIKKFDLEKIRSFHNKSGSIATMVLTKVRDANGYGIPILNKHGLVRNFFEKSNKNDSGVFINSGLYIFDPKIFRIPTSYKRILNIETDIIPLLINMKLLSGLKIDGHWVNCGDYNNWKRIIENN